MEEEREGGRERGREGGREGGKRGGREGGECDCYCISLFRVYQVW